MASTTVEQPVSDRPAQSRTAVAVACAVVLDYQETPGSRTLDGHERLLALDEGTGAVLWTQEWPAAYRNIHYKFAIGPRATPAVDGDRVQGVTVPVFGVSQSPLVEGEHLIALLGGEPDMMVVAFDKATGAEAWRAIETTSEAGQYSSPIVIDDGGVRQLIVWYPAAVTSLDPATGDIWWQHDFPVPSGYTIGTPVRNGRYLLVTQVENGGLMLALNPDRPAARLLWEGIARFTPGGYEEVDRTLLLTPTTRTQGGATPSLVP